MTIKKHSKKIMAVVVTIAIISYLDYVYFVPPTGEGAHIKCMTKTILGLNCMSCGLTRFVYFAMHGEFAIAFQYNIMGPLLVVALLIFFFYFLRWSFYDKPFPEIPVWFAWAFLAFAVIYSVFRNLPFEQFKFLAPPS